MIPGSWNNPVPVSHTVDAVGFVLVDGQRVPFRHGELLKHRAEDRATCQRCNQLTVRVPLVVVREHEPAMGSDRYYMSPERVDRQCAECAVRSVA